MLSAKTTGWMLIAGLGAFILLFIAQAMQGDQGGPEGAVAWAAANDDWQILAPIRMIAGMVMIIFTAGFIAWARSIDDSSCCLAFGKYAALLGLIMMWVGVVSQVAGFETAAENTDAAYALIKLSNFGIWVGVCNFLFSFFVVGATAYMKKSGTPVLNVLLALAGIVGFAGSFISWFFWLGGFVLALLLLTIIGIQKIVRS